MLASAAGRSSELFLHYWIVLSVPSADQSLRNGPRGDHGAPAAVRGGRGPSAWVPNDLSGH